MSPGPTLIIDKSTLQGLKVNEAEWLAHHFNFNVIEPLYMEIFGLQRRLTERIPKLTR